MLNLSVCRSFSEPLLCRYFYPRSFSSKKLSKSGNVSIRFSLSEVSSGNMPSDIKQKLHHVTERQSGTSDSEVQSDSGMTHELDLNSSGSSDAKLNLANSKHSPIDSNDFE